MWVSSPVELAGKPTAAIAAKAALVTM